VAGYNYGWDKYAADHARVPDRIIVGTESFPAQSFQNWDLIWNSSYLLGDFIWTAMDYIGESSIGANGRNTPDLQACGGYCPRGWAYHIAYCGDIDLVGHRKPQSIYRNVLWNNTQLEVAVHAPVPAGQHEVIASWGFADERQSWTWDVAATDPPLSVNVYSQFPHVQLLLNGKPADAAQASPVAVSRATEFKATFSVPYAAGELTAVAFGPDGAAVAKRTLFSAGAPAGIVLRADRAAIAASRDDLSYVTATVVDKDGNPTPSEDTIITFSLDGGANAEIAAVGSGDPQDSGSFHAASRKTYRGKAVAIVRPGKTNIPATSGSATLTASAPGLGAGTTLRITYE
jgi:beta-galactosidase